MLVRTFYETTGLRHLQVRGDAVNGDTAPSVLRVRGKRGLWGEWADAGVGTGTQQTTVAA